MWLAAHAADLSPSGQQLSKAGFTNATAVGFALDSLPARQAKRDRQTRHPILAQRLEGRLIDAWEQQSTEGVNAAVATLSARGARTEGEKVIVIVQCTQGDSAKEVAESILKASGTIVRIGQKHVKAAVPVRALEAVAKLQGVSFVRTPEQKRQLNTVITEGRGPTGSGLWQAAGFTGQGVKVAVIDGGFAGLGSRKAADEIPASAIEVDLSGTGMTSGSSGHGNACAEIIYDMAPGCQLYLIKAMDISDDEAAKNYCKAQGMQIISFSAGYDALNFHDGVAYSSIEPHPVAIANDANANGILWVNAAGNEQLQHATIGWRDNNIDQYLDWTSSADLNELWNGGSLIPAGTVIDVFLSWNAWPVTDQDFDLDLFRLEGSLWRRVTTADEIQNGTQPPAEHLRYTATTTAFYAVGIRKYSATTSPTFILRAYPYDLYYYAYNNYNNPVPGSLSIPADAASCFSVGAIHQGVYVNGPLAIYSSLGPNNGAYTGKPVVLKPDICGPDAVRTATYGVTPFVGTSAAAPHVAAMAALVKGRYPGYNNSQLRGYIEQYGVDLGPIGKDNSYGSGPCVLPSPIDPPSITQQPVGVTTNLGARAVFTVSATGTEPLTYQWRRNGIVVAGATNPTLVLTNLQLAQAGAYSVRVTNFAASVISSNAALVVDGTGPTLSITSPMPNERWSNTVFTAAGTATDNVGLGRVTYQLNNGAWTDTQGTTNWSANLTLTPGSNVFRVYALDTVGNRSVTNTVNFFYVVTNQLLVRAIGQGTISPNYSNAVLEIGRSYSMMATGINGHVFSNWLVSTNWIGGELKPNTALTFSMQSNLTVLVNFADAQRPAVSITNPASARTYTNAQLVSIRATASDNVSVTRVEFYDGPVLKGTDTNAAYAYDWALTAGDNGAHVWTARAFDLVGNVSTSSPVTLTVSIDTNLPTVAISNPANGSTVTTPTITVSGTASDPGSPSSGLNLVEVRVNGGSWSNASGTTSWTRSVTLTNCRNAIEARSRDRATNYSVIASNFVFFTPVNTTPLSPTNLSPTANAIGVPVAPMLSASAFRDPDPVCLGDTHAASHWQVLNSAGVITVADSGTNTSSLTSWVVPTNRLFFGSNYQWRVRYRDSRNGWSSYSPLTAFTTSGPQLIGNRIGTNIVFKWPTNAIGFGLQSSPTLTSINWSNVPPSPVIAGGQYTVTNSVASGARFYRLKK